MPSCLRLFWQLKRAAASRTFWTAGSKRPMRMAMMAITTNSSISVNAWRLAFGGGLGEGTIPKLLNEGRKKSWASHRESRRGRNPFAADRCRIKPWSDYRVVSVPGADADEQIDKQTTRPASVNARIKCSVIGGGA